MAEEKRPEKKESPLEKLERIRSKIESLVPDEDVFLPENMIKG